MDIKNGNNKMNTKMNYIDLTYFSGTGGTERIAYLVKEYLEENNKIVEIHFINANYLKEKITVNDSTDLLLLLYPVYAFDAPKIVYDWCKLLPEGNKINAGIISVSGGGEVGVNSACRIGIKKQLEKKGYLVCYENMVKMPSNWMIETPEQEALKLIKELPHTIKTIADEILTGKQQKIK
ncbi:MAG: hypothetical protein FWC45_05890 [Treponema sp.]|nr:hypothetical protein [Treponema sp.]